MSDNPTSGERRPDRAGLAIAVGLAILAAIVAVNTYNLPEGVATYSRIGPRAFPYSIAVGLFLVAAATVFAAWHGDFPGREKDDYRPMAWIVGGLVVQLALISHAGFAIATGAVFAATARAFGRGPVWFTYPIGVLLSLAIWLAFAQGLNLVLPQGPVERYALEQLRKVIGMLSGAG